MKNLLLIAQREYLVRVKKKSFIIMTFLSPLLLALFYGVIIYITLNSDIADSQKKIAVCDQTGLLQQQLSDTKTLQFEYINHYNDAEALLKANLVYAVLLVEPKSDTAKTDNQNYVFTLKTVDNPSINTISVLESKISNILKSKKLKELGIDEKIIHEINTGNITINTLKISGETETETSTGFTTVLAVVGGLIIYLFIFLYGVQVMRGVIDEKTSRVVEVIISSVRPFQLMAGKITGIALVGITQFVAWVLLLFVFITAGTPLFKIFSSTDISQLAQTAGNTALADTKADYFLKSLLNFDFTGYLLVFLFYFTGGYLFYGALFAAIGSAVDNETDTQQFMLPVTLPLIFSIVIAQNIVLNAPNSAASFWLSVIPFTSPVIMLIRYPFEVPLWQLITSMLVLVAGILAAVWLAAKIYRIGILSYGKKPGYKEIWNWLFIKN